MMRFADVADLVRAAEQWILPGQCLCCSAAVGPADPLICAPCQSRWRTLPHPQCSRCGQPLTTVASGCRICPAWPEELGRVRSAVWFEAGVRSAVHQLKYGGWWRVAEPMARRMARLEPVQGAAALVPIPLGASRARSRGYNQAERLARALSEVSGLPLRTDLLTRMRETRTQTALAPEQRRANIAGAFQPGPIARGMRVVLIDDVFTTGATLAEAARTVGKAGAGVVEAVTFARAMPPLW